MKGKYLIAIAFLASWTVIRADEAPITFEAEDECPTTDSCPPKLIKHEKDCDKYYECKQGKRILRPCQKGLFFSKKWNGCVNQGISDCASTPIPTPTPTSRPNECPAIDPYPPVLLNHETDCAKYYECRKGEKLLYSCAEGLFFSQKWRGCVRQELSDCAPPTPPPTTTPPSIPTPTSTPNECPAVDPYPPVLLNHDKDCDKYYECRQGEKLSRSCAEGLFFSKKWRGCVSKELSDCAPATPSPTPPSGECLEGDLIVHECECNQFYLCRYGQKVLRFCPAEYHFDPYQKKCLPGSECNFCKEGEYSRHECECNMFYECKSGKLVLRECNLGTIFNGNTCVPGTCQ